MVSANIKNKDAQYVLNKGIMLGMSLLYQLGQDLLVSPHHLLDVTKPVLLLARGPGAGTGCQHHFLI